MTLAFRRKRRRGDVDSFSRSARTGRTARMSLDAVYRPGSTKPLRRDAGLELVGCEAGRRSRSGRPRSSAAPCVAGIRRLPIGRTTTALPIELSAPATLERSGGATGGRAPHLEVVLSRRPHRLAEDDRVHAGGGVDQHAPSLLLSCTPGSARSRTSRR